MPAARLLRAVAPDAPADADLLGRFVAARDEAAFAELVRRHGPAVLAVCRRVTTHTHDAEDAFQAAFLVLARKAHRVRAGEPLAAWLYGVAVRAARKAAVRTFRRHDRETLMADLPDVPDCTAEPFYPDAARVVMEEVNRLSAKYRAAVVLCELEGRSRPAAARELGIAEGTLSSRLAAARKQLAARLAARGCGPTALAALVGAAVPSELTASTSALVTGPAPAVVASLASEVVRAMLLDKLRLPATVLGFLAAGVTAVALAAPQNPPPAGPPPKAAPPAATEFDQLVVGVNPGAFSPEIPCTLTLAPNGKCVHEVVGYPARGAVPAWPAAKRAHTLPPEQARRLAAALKATDWLGKAVEKEPLKLHQPNYALTLRRAGKEYRVACEGEPAPYTDLLKLARGLASQEFLAYRLEDVPNHAAYARYVLDTYARAELGGPYGKPLDHFDYARFGGWAKGVVRAAAARPPDDLAAAARLLGLLRLASEREALAVLTRHTEPSVRDAAREALARLPEPK